MHFIFNLFFLLILNIYIPFIERHFIWTNQSDKVAIVNGILLSMRISTRYNTTKTANILAKVRIDRLEKMPAMK